MENSLNLPSLTVSDLKHKGLRNTGVRVNARLAVEPNLAAGVRAKRQVKTQGQTTGRMISAGAMGAAVAARGNGLDDGLVHIGHQFDGLEQAW
jgi:hypothetical protein